jgi:hypothetical protein
VFTLRCTQRLLARSKVKLATESIEPTTRLGDWYANLLHLGRLQIVLAVSERTFLPVLVPAAPGATLVPRLREGLAFVLRALDVARVDIEREVSEMESVAYGKTANRQVTGIMVDFAKALEFYIEDDQSLLAVALKLARTPCSPFYKTEEISPDRKTVALFGRPPLRLVR